MLPTAVATSRRLIGLATGHIPVMVNQVVEHLNLAEGKIVVDMTFGAGGHTKKILEQCPGVKVVGLDRDPLAHKAAQKLSAEEPGRLVPLFGRFSQLPELMRSAGLSPAVDGMLFDLGCSSMQMDDGARGFSISKEGPLDMRMDSSTSSAQPTAADLLSSLQETDLARIFKVYGEERQARKIARAVVEARREGMAVRTTGQLAALVAEVCGSERRLDKLQRPAHVATKVFQALRILVNDELNEINYGMLLAGRLIRPGGRLVCIAFHSLEDTLVKRHLGGYVSDNLAQTMAPSRLHLGPRETCWRQLHRGVLTPSETEVFDNPRSRSAKMRVAEKVK